MLCNGFLYLLAAEHGEDLYIPCRILVGYVQPELVELVRACPFRIEPDVAFLGLAEFASVGLCDKRAGECEGLFPELSADQLRSGGDVSPLVAASHLERAALVLVEPEVVIPLQKLVCELRERHPLP